MMRRRRTIWRGTRIKRREPPAWVWLGLTLMHCGRAVARLYPADADTSGHSFIAQCGARESDPLPLGAAMSLAEAWAREAGASVAA
jgi:hypothetical protein